MLSQMNHHLMERYGNQRSYVAEATYYLDVTNYNFKEALDEFDEDMKFEKENNKKYPMKKKQQ